VCRATLGGTGDDQRPPTRAKQARRRLTRRIVVVIVMAGDIKVRQAGVKARDIGVAEAADKNFRKWTATYLVS
jgi:hypothetical protein